MTEKRYQLLLKTATPEEAAVLYQNGLIPVHLTEWGNLDYASGLGAFYVEGAAGIVYDWTRNHGLDQSEIANVIQGSQVLPVEKIILQNEDRGCVVTDKSGETICMAHEIDSETVPNLASPGVSEEKKYQVLLEATSVKAAETLYSFGVLPISIVPEDDETFAWDSTISNYYVQSFGIEFEAKDSAAHVIRDGAVLPVEKCISIDMDSSFIVSTPEGQEAIPITKAVIAANQRSAGRKNNLT